MAVLLLNDTDEAGAHFGCKRVMHTIRTELAVRGLSDLGSLKVGTDWKSDPDARARIDAARLVVINGEGTLHHGKRKGRWLLEAGARVKANGGKVALVNALWQLNPDDWGGLARDFDLLWCRDSRSADALRSQTSASVDWMGDLSMLNPPPDNSGAERRGVTVSCSVDREVTERLAAFADRVGADYVPVTTEIKTVSAQLRGVKRLWRQAYARLYTRRFMAAHPRTRLLQSDTGYLAHLGQRELLVTGRFHAVCLAVLTHTPFVAVASNSWKIEALLADIGLDPARVQPLSAVEPGLLSGRSWAFSASELAGIEASLGRWRAQGHQLFDRIADFSR